MRNGIRRSKDLRAKTRKFLVLTNERKKMSKTTIKQRIALVAIAALGGSFLTIASVAPAQAATGAVTQSVESSGIISALGSGSAVTMSSDGILFLDLATGTTAVSVTGGRITGYNAGTSTAPGTNNIPTIQGSNGFSSSALIIENLSFVPTAAGTNMVIKFYATAASAAATPVTAATAIAAGTAVEKTITVTVYAPGTSGTLSLGKTWISVNALASTTSTVADTQYENFASGANEIIINYDLVDALGTAGTANMPASSQVQAQVTSGSCLVHTTAASATLPVYSEYANAGEFYVASSAYPSPTDCVVTISVNGTVVSTKSLKFYGSVTKITFNGPTFTGKNGNTTAAPAGKGYITAQDSAGNTLGGVALTGDATTFNSIVNNATGVTTSSQVNGQYPGSTPSAITFACTALGGSTTVKYTASGYAGATITSDAIPVSCAKDANTYTASLDKASYAPGDIATLTISAKDSSARNVNDAMVLGTTVANGPAILGSQLTAVTAPTYTDTFAAGVKTYKYIVGSTTGSYNLVVDLPYLNAISTVGQTAVTIAYKVTASTTEVSNAEVLKSIVALIASINKQIQALQKLILARR